MAGFLSRLLTLGEGKQLKNYEALVQKVNALEGGMQAKSDAELAALTAAFRERADNGEDLKSLLPEAFAAVREASVRTLGLRHFDVQLIGGMALNDGQIAEMKTGEGKTLVSTLAGYLNALNGNNVHIVTVNDYLARRDSEWMGQIYRFLGMNVGLIQNGMRPDKKIPAYQAEVTYGTNSEFGFDYLRDNMVTRAEARVQRGHHFAIVDEVDSILIDEARTPLIISGAGTQAAETYNKFARVMPGLVPEVDFDMDEAKKTINATESGLEKIESMLGIDDIYADPSGQLANHLQQALKAQFLFHRDVDYVVVDGEVKIVDEFTGRIMEGRRWSEGLHQAVEAKEKVLVREENQTLATITLQNYFRLYEKLSGMTGTAMTEDAEFREIYKLPVVAIPPNRPVARKDEDDLIYRTVEAKFNAVADDVAARNAKGQPCLIGTVSIESSEKLSRLLDKRGIKHETLNAKNHEREAHIIAQAGRVGAVTIATNMAGRGTDILLGGNPDVMAEDALRAQGVLGHDVGVAAEQDVGAAAGHVRGDGNGAHAAGLRDDVRLALVVLRVERLVLDAALVQEARELLGALDGHRADEAGLALGVARGHVVGHGVELRLHRAVDEVVLVLSRDGAVRRDGHDGQLVDLAELGILGHGGAGHAGELLVEAEVILQRDGGERLVLLAHEHLFLGLHRLVQALRPAAALHDAAGELVDDLHLAVHHDVVHVAVEQELRLERLLQVVGQLARRVGVDVVDPQHGLDLLQAALGGVDGLLRLVHVEVHLGDETGHDARELVVRLGRLRAGARDDERGAGLVDEDGVHLVDDGEVVAALHAGLRARDHVVAQVVEAELGVRAVRDLGLVGGDLLVGAHAVLDEAHVHAQEAVDLAHPLAVAAGQVVVHGDDVHVVAVERVQVAGQRGHERLALAGLHLGDLPVVERHAADELHVEVAQAERAH